MKILVATDGSRAGTAAVRFASRLLGESRSGTLIVLTVELPAAMGHRGGSLRREGGGAERALKESPSGRGMPRARRRIAFAPSVDEVSEVISREANRLEVDLIVVGSEGRESLAGWVVGRTALRLIYVARRPVAVVRAPRRRRTGRER